MFEAEMELSDQMSYKANNLDTEDRTGVVHVESLFRYAMFLTRNRNEAEDLVQETFLRSLKSRNILMAATNLEGWLFVVLRNVWFNQLRAQRNSPIDVPLEAASPDSLVDTSISSCEQLEKDEEEEQVRAAIRQLPHRFREIIVLREYEDLSYKQIGAVLNIPQGTVMSRLRRARRKLLHLLSNSIMP
jgi:RNA polymerase sigma-70 factor, ECF subfamily